MEPNYDFRQFLPFGPSHLVALTVLVSLGCFSIWMHSRRKFSDEVRKNFDRGLAIILLLSVAADPMLCWIRYAPDPELRWRLLVQNSLPFYLCDVVSIVLAVALFTNRQRWVELGYLWGVAGTTQGLITPTLFFDWDTPEYYAFFAQHGGVPLAAVSLVFGMGIYPQPGAWKRAVGWSAFYMLIVFGLNAVFHANYGFLNEKPKVPTLMDHMGPWPWYLVALLGLASVFFMILLALARFFHPHPHPTGRSQA
jgi:hypothetical integral membrane protein (TIGR02206 family)